MENYPESCTEYSSMSAAVETITENITFLFGGLWLYQRWERTRLQEARPGIAIGAAVVLLHEPLQRNAVDGRILLAPVHLQCQLRPLQQHMVFKMSFKNRFGHLNGTTSTLSCTTPSPPLSMSLIGGKGSSRRSSRFFCSDKPAYKGGRARTAQVFPDAGN